MGHAVICKARIFLAVLKDGKGDLHCMGLQCVLSHQVQSYAHDMAWQQKLHDKHVAAAWHSTRADAQDD